MMKNRGWINRGYGIKKRHRHPIVSFTGYFNTPILIFLLIFSVFLENSLAAPVNLPQEHHLPNGLQVITHEMHHAPLVFLAVVYDAAPRNEHMGVTGISHMLEHMMFMGTQNHPGEQFISDLQRRGATLNGFTTNDLAAYYDFFPAEFLEEILRMEADRMQNLQLDSLIFLKERNVVRNERLRKKENSERAMIDEDFKNLFYRTHPYRNPSIGYLQDIDNFTLKKVRDYYNTYYRPDNAVLILVGDFETEPALQQIRSIFGFRKPGAGPERREIFELPPAGKRQVTYRSKIFRDPEINFHFHVPEIGHPDAPALDALMYILGRPSSRLGRLKEVLVEKTELAERAGTAGFSFRDAGFLSIKVAAKDTAGFPEITRQVKAVAAALKTAPVDERELTAYKIHTRYMKAMEGNSIRGFGEKLIYYSLMGGVKYRIEEEPQQKMALTPADIRRVAQKYLDFKHCLVEYRIPQETAAGEGDTPENSGRSMFVPGEEKTGDKMKNNSGLFKISGQVKKTVLPNGIRVYQLRNPSGGLWGIQGFFETGNITENDSFPGIGRMLVSLMRKDTRFHSELELSRKLDYYQIRQGFGGGSLDFMLYGESLEDYADTLLTAMRERLFYPRFSGENREEYVELAHKFEQNDKNNPKALANEKIMKLIFPGHPYAREDEKAPGKLEKVSAEMLEKMRRKYLRPERLTLLVYGPADSLQNIRKISEYFGGEWPGEQAGFQPEPVPAAKFHQSDSAVHVADPGRQVAEIRIAFPGPALSDSDALTFEQVSNLLARGSVSSYLGKILRNQLGLTYYIGLNSDGGPRPRGGSLIIQSQVSRENVKKFLNVTRKLLAEFPESLTAEDWQKTKSRLQLAYIKKWDDYMDVVQRVFTTLRQGQSLARLDDYRQRLNDIGFADLQRVARRYIDPEQMVILIYGPKGNE